MAAPNNVVWKYRFRLDNVVKIEMPSGAQVLTVQLQDGGPTLWAMVNSENGLEQRRFCIRATGEVMGEEVGHYIGTFQVYLNGSVFHVFELERGQA